MAVVPRAMQWVHQPLLMVYTEEGNLEKVGPLLDLARLDPTNGDFFPIDQISGETERTALCHAASRGHLAMVELLLDKGARADILDVCGWGPMHWAAYRGGYDMVQLLVDRRIETHELIQGRPFVSRNFGGTKGIARVEHPDNYCIVNLHTWQAIARRFSPEIMPQIEAVQTGRPLCEAFAMGHHDRLGEKSRVLSLELGVVRIIVQFVLGQYRE
jgi:ankyrin repeat protein